MNVRDDQYLQLMADCIPVQGAKNSAIYDLSRGCIHSFPSDFFDIFKAFEDYSYGALKKIVLENGDMSTLEEFLDFLDQNDMIMILDDSERSLFPKINIDTWEKPCQIQNAIIDIKDKIFDFRSIFSQLDDLGCEFVQIRQYCNHYTLEDVHQLLQEACDKSILGVELLLAYDFREDEQAYQRILLENPIVSSLCVHSAPESKVELVDFDEQNPGLLGKGLSFTTKKLSSSDHCGVINQSSLTIPRADIVSEFKQFNGCLNRKISIDHEGFIKNCPSMSRAFGKVDEVRLEKALDESGFKDVWFHHKELIEDCKVCEYRYVCSDCRAYTQGDGALTKPEKCTYDPYTGRWE